MSSDIEKYINKFGEEYRLVITDSLKWLEKNEFVWGLSKPIDREHFLRDLLGKVSK